MPFCTGITSIILVIFIALFVVFILAHGANSHHEPVKVYLAGTMSGNSNDGIVNQDYRKMISGLLREVYPELEIDDPYIGHEDSLSYDDDQARHAFNDCLHRAAYGADVLIAYLPEASMGTALEIYEASKRGNYIIIITPLTNNWVIRLYGNGVFPSIDAFSACLLSGEFGPIFYSAINDFDGSRIWKS